MIVDIDILAPLLTTPCCIALLLTWFLLPKWRSLHNFIGLHQVLAGTLHLYSMAIFHILLLEFVIYSDVLISVNGYLFMIAASWSFCASLFAYLKLRLVYMQKISCEKTKTLILAYGMTTILQVIIKGIVPALYPPLTMFSQTVPSLLCVYHIETVNMILFVSVIASVFSSGNRSLREKGKRVIALVGVAIMCDMATIIYMLSMLPKFLVFEYDVEILKMMFAFRLIPQSIVLLFNRPTRKLWQEYLARRRHRRLNNF
ncbi:unnamed protein product [Colias eurytheme]|nr:unnamed protein product [Colias eurytheme]